jgi:hypothetical protein
MKQASPQYVVSFQTERYCHGTRYHWMICVAQKPDELVSWGYALTQEVAERAAQAEANDLSSGLTQGGRVRNTKNVFTRR